MHHEVDLISALGYESILAEKEEIKGLNFGFGIGYRYYIHDYGITYLGCQIKKNYVNFATNNGTDLDGDILTFRIDFGYTLPSSKPEKLKNLEYRY